MTLPEPGHAAWGRTKGRFLLALALLLLLVIGLGRAPLFDVDEGAFSEATREMVSSGDWGHTTLNGADRFDKPIGVYWLQAASMTVFGSNEFAMRLPSALATWLASLALGAFVANRLGGRAGALAAVIHATSLGSWAMAHAATADAVLGLWLVLSALDLWRFLERGDVHALHRLGAWVGLGLLVKGPVAALIPLAALLLSCLAQRQWRPLCHALRSVQAWAWMLALSVPWYAYALWRHGQAFVDGFFVKHNLERFSAPMEGHAGGWLYFVLVAPLLWMPWSPLLLAWWGRLGLLWRDALTRHALIWAGFVLVFFSLSGTKLPHYGLYAAPGVVVLLAAASQQVRPWLWWLCGGMLLCWHALLVGLPVALMHWPDRWPTELAAMVQGTSARMPVLVILALWAWLAFALAVWRGRRLLGSSGILSVMALLHALVLGLMVWPWWARTLQGPVKTLGLAARVHTGVVVQSGGNWPSFAFYRRQATPHGAPAPGEIAVLRSADLQNHPDWEVLASERGMSLVRHPMTQPSAPASSTTPPAQTLPSSSLSAIPPRPQPQRSISP